ncbi:MerR family transcriptional regulator [Longirhabdus pacifica]|uniref:MerR family transcriptional regulator n=1 Tax=Longirhabdus pacifica TaxID=2305227 RepID=UPI001008ED22|nr:MerR family transcriptional regulator [Longirhabdus pacifica]
MSKATLENKFKIGEVSKMYSIPQSTLRFYDKKGIFQPEFIDENSNYRYYTMEQLIMLDTIKFMRKIGFSVKDIQDYINNLTLEETQKLLQAKLTDLQTEMEAIQETATILEKKVALIQFAKQLREQNEVTYEFIPERTIHVVNTIPTMNPKTHYSLYVRELKNSIPLNNVDFFTGDIGIVTMKEDLRLKRSPQYKGIFYLCDQTTHQCEGETKLPAGLFACYPHHGSQDTMDHSYKKILSDLDKRNYDIIGDGVELTVIDKYATKDQSELITLIQIPIKNRIV